MQPITPDSNPSVPPGPKPIWLAMGLVAILGLGYAGSQLVGKMFDNTLTHGRMPVLATVDQDFTGTDRTGQQVQFSQLKGKVCVVGYIYTICPHGCAAVIGEMKSLLKQHGTRSDFHLVSVTVVPERDTPTMLNSYAEAMEVKPTDPWWFVNGDRVQMDAFMSEGLRLAASKPIPEDQRMNPLDLYEHDLRLTLIDRKGRVRGHYQVAHPQVEIAEMAKLKLQQQVTSLLNNPNL